MKGATLTLRVSDDNPDSVVEPRAISSVHDTDVSAYCVVCARVAVMVVVPIPTILTTPDVEFTVANDGSDDKNVIAPLLSFVALTVKLALP